MAEVEEVTERVTEESVEPGEMVTEVLLRVQVQPEGQDFVRLKTEELQLVVSLLLILKVKVLVSPGLPVWGELVAVTVGAALAQTVTHWQESLQCFPVPQESPGLFSSQAVSAPQADSHLPLPALPFVSPL